jgi:hypothetical protein
VQVFKYPLHPRWVAYDPVAAVAQALSAQAGVAKLVFHSHALPVLLVTH